MDELFSLHEHGVFLRGEALEFGYNDRHLVEAVRARFICKVRHGAYVAAGVWTTSSPVERYRLQGQAVLLRHGTNVALSHTSGAAELGLRLWEVDLRRVHVTRLDGGPSRIHGDVAYHRGSWTPHDIVQQGEALILSPVRCALGTAALNPVEQGVVVLDSLLDLDLGTPDDVYGTYQLIRTWPHTARLEVAVRLMEPGAQSVGESRFRMLCFIEHLPKPVLQFEVYDHSGKLIGTTDFAWPEHKQLGEFDGRIKYGRLLKPGEKPEDAVFREKVREDKLREASGFGMMRFTWGDLHTRRATGARVRRMLGTRPAA